MPSIKQSETSQATTIGASTAETTIVAADPNFRRNLSGLVITTLNAAASTLTLRDSAAGLTKAVFDYPNAAAVPTTPFIVNFDPPLQQDTKNTTWTIQASASATGFKITALFVSEN
jgi:hypothetical protein